MDCFGQLFIHQTPPGEFVSGKAAAIVKRMEVIVMSMENQLKKLNEAVAALEKSEGRERLNQLFDDGTFVELDRLARDGDNPAEAVAGFGLVNGTPAYAFSQDKAVCSGCVSRAQAAKIRRIYELAAQNGAPVVGIFDSDGARLTDGIDAMDAIAEILTVSNTLSGVVPQIAVVAGACVGSSALIASNADIVIAVKDADFYLNSGDEKDTAAVPAGDVFDAVEKARELLALLPSNNLSSVPVYEFNGAAMAACDSIDGVIEALADDGTVFSLKPDAACQTVLARLGGVACGMVTLSGDAVCDCAASRVARFVRLCDSFSLPVVTFVDAAGFKGLKGAAKLSHAYAEATTAKLTVIVGRAYGPVYIAAAGKTAGADAVLAWPCAVISPVAPETAIHILWRDRLEEMKNPSVERDALAEEYAETEGSPLKAAADGVITDVIAPQETKARLMAMLEMLSGKRIARLPKKHSNIQL